LTTPATQARCSPLTRSLGADPIGAVGGGASFLLVELPLPWPKDIGADPRLARLQPAIQQAERRWRVQAVVSAQSTGDTARIVAYDLPDGAFRRYEHRELLVAPDQLEQAAIEMIGADRREQDNPYLVAPAAEFLLCTHGTRDTCCGSLGAALWRDASRDELLGPDGGRLWRTSHTGGHRFAATGVHLPTGTSWAWLDADLLTRIVHRDIAVEKIIGNYRGSSAASSLPEQVVERAVFERVGWAWLEHHRTFQTVATDEHATTVEVSYTDPDGHAGAYRGVTAVAGSMPVPDCGKPLSEARKSMPLVTLQSFEQVR
jgi:hypothetical protein